MIQRTPQLPEPRAQAALVDSPIADLRSLTVALVDNRLCLRGSVSSYYHKQMAQQTILAVADADGLEVANHIVVVKPEARSAKSAR